MLCFMWCSASPFPKGGVCFILIFTCFTLVPDVHPSPSSYGPSIPHSFSEHILWPSLYQQGQARKGISFNSGRHVLLGQVVRRRGGKECTLCTFVALDASAPLCLCKCVSHDILKVTLVRIYVFMTSFPYLVVMKFTTL